MVTLLERQIRSAAYIRPVQKEQTGMLKLSNSLTMKVKSLNIDLVEVNNLTKIAELDGVKIISIIVPAEHG